MYHLTNSDNADFYIQTVGATAGKPLEEKSANSIGVIANSVVLDSRYFFYLVKYLYEAGAFARYLHGSVIPFLTVQSIEKVLNEYFS